MLGGVIEMHLNHWEEKEPELVAKIRKELYVNDLISGSTTVCKTRGLKDKTTTIFQDACFNLHKWHSNVPELELGQSPQEEGEQTYAKQQLGVPQGTFSSIRGLPWNKEQDSLSITVPPEKATLSKRGILAKLAKIYDPLGLVSPETLSSKLIYRAICDTKGAWDANLSGDLAKLLSGKADYQKVSPYRDHWLLIERKSHESIYIRLETRAHEPAFMQSSDKHPELTRA